jgi:hypothetical protein
VVAEVLAHIGNYASCTADSANRVECGPNMNRPIFKKIERAQSVIVQGRHLFLKECKKCGTDFYGVEKQTRCNECVGRKGKHAS